MRAKGTVKCIALAREKLQVILGNKIVEVIQKNWQRWALENDKVFCKLTKIQREKWILNATIRKVKQDEIIYRGGEKFNSLIIVVEGSAIDALEYKEYTKGTVFHSSYIYSKKSDINSNPEYLDDDEDYNILKDDFYMKTDGLISC